MFKPVHCDEYDADCLRMAKIVDPGYRYYRPVFLVKALREYAEYRKFEEYRCEYGHQNVCYWEVYAESKEWRWERCVWFSPVNASLQFIAVKDGSFFFSFKQCWFQVALENISCISRICFTSRSAILLPLGFDESLRSKMCDHSKQVLNSADWILIFVLVLRSLLLRRADRNVTAILFQRRWIFRT